MLIKANECLHGVLALCNISFDFFYSDLLLSDVPFGFLHFVLGRLEQLRNQPPYFALDGEEPHIVARLLFRWSAFAVAVAVTTPII